MCPRQARLWVKSLAKRGSWWLPMRRARLQPNRAPKLASFLPVCIAFASAPVSDHSVFSSACGGRSLKELASFFSKRIAAYAARFAYIRLLFAIAARCWLALFFGAGAGVLAQQQPVIRVNVDLVRIIATVRNASGELTGALQKSDFEVSDNGVPQEVAVFERQTEQPLSVALLVDCSGSTAKDLKYETDSASQFLRALFAEGNPQDAVSLYSFNWEVVRHNYFSRNVAAFERSLKLFHGEAGTSLYDAIYLAAQDLESRDGRKIIVIVTDGGDTTSSTDLRHALDAAQLADAVIYPVVVMPITSDAGRNIGGENALTYMARGTGGRTFLPTLGPELDKAFSDIIEELRTEYLLGFYPQNVPLTKERFHRLEVRVRRPELRVSARNGYYGDAEGVTNTPGARVTLGPPGKSSPATKKQ
jgi:Ca-activated chloride channel homolog